MPSMDFIAQVRRDWFCSSGAQEWCGWLRPRGVRRGCACCRRRCRTTSPGLCARGRTATPTARPTPSWWSCS